MQIRHEDFIRAEEEAQTIFRQAGWEVELVTDYERIEIVVERAYLETIFRDTSSFLFTGFGSAISEFSSVLLGGDFSIDTDYRA